MTKKLPSIIKDQRKMRRQALTMIKNLVKDERNPINFKIEEEQIAVDLEGRPVYSGIYFLNLRFTMKRRIRKTPKNFGGN